MMEDAMRYLQGRIKRTEKQVESIKNIHGDNPGKTHTYYGGWALGYYEGMLTAYHNILDKLVAHKKQTPVNLTLRNSGVCECPNCKTVYSYTEYCGGCGQKLNMDSVK